MKVKFTWWQMIVMAVDGVGAVFLFLCLFTDIADTIFLPVALSLILAANLLQLIMLLKTRKK